MERKQITFILWLLLLWGTAACNEPDLPTLTAVEIVEQSAVRMKTADGFRFVIERDGAPAYLDPDDTFSFRRARGAFVAPDRAIATVRVIGPGLITDVDVITIADVQWQTNLVTSEWEELPPNWGFNPAVLFDDEVGLQAVLTSDLSNLEQLPPENLAESEGPDQLLYTVTANVAGDRLYEMSGFLIGPQEVSVQLWIAPETFELIRAVVTEPEPDSEEEFSTWQIDFSNYGELVEIEPPPVAE